MQGAEEGPRWRGGRGHSVGGAVTADTRPDCSRAGGILWGGGQVPTLMPTCGGRS